MEKVIVDNVIGMSIRLVKLASSEWRCLEQKCLQKIIIAILILIRTNKIGKNQNK